MVACLDVCCGSDQKSQGAKGMFGGDEVGLDEL
jgi:hypothetical protein